MLFCLCATTRPVAAQGIRFLDQPEWKQVLRMAGEQNRFVFMDCYTTWCGPCKSLAEKVFPQPEVGEFFNTSFINVKYDMEKGEGKELHERYKSFIIGFPTLLLIDKDGNVVHQMAGYHEPESLIAGMKAGLEGKTLFALKARYEAGQRDADFLREYVSALDGAFLKDDIQKVAVDYMGSLPLDSLLSPENWTLVGDYVNDPYSPQFEFVLRNITKIVYKLNADGYKLERNLSNALERAVVHITRLQTDNEGKIMSLTNDEAKISRLKELIDIAELKRAETLRAILRVHELKLAAEWQRVLDHIDYYSRIKAMGYTNRFTAETMQYIAFKSSDEAILRQCLAVMENIQRSEDSARAGSNYYNILAIIYRRLGDDAAAEKSQAVYDEYKKKMEAEWEAIYKPDKNTDDHDE